MAVRTTDTPKETTEVGEGPAISVWTGQYKKNWNSIITSESFSHPAKFARGLIETIVDHALEEGWVKPGDHCIDPFGGIATGAYACISKGLRWTGVELEEHFHNLGVGCDCTGISTSDYARLYGRWPRMHYAHGHYLCPRCLAQVAQVTGERRPVQRIFCTQPREGCEAVWTAARTRKPYADVRPGPQPNTVEKTYTYQPLPFPDRRDGYGPPPRVQALFAQETASYARSSGVIPHTAPHHYEGNLERWERMHGFTGATLLQGDSRNLRQLLAQHYLPATQESALVREQVKHSVEQPSQQYTTHAGTPLPQPIPMGECLVPRHPDHDPLLAKYLFAKVTQTDLCWEWRGRKHKHGYGRFSIAEKEFLAHRTSWLLHYGAIPDGVLVLHKCDNPPCVRPDHLFLGTPGDNWRDTCAKKRAWMFTAPEKYLRGIDSPNAKLTEDQVVAIRTEYANEKTQQRTLAQRYGVSKGLIYNILHGLAWTHLLPGNLPPGSLDAALAPGTEDTPQLDLLVSSSPYAQSLSDATSRIDWSKAKGNPAGFHTPGKGDIPANYGTTAGQLGALPPGSLDAALTPGADLTITSPVYGAALSEAQNMRETDKAHLRERGRNPDSPGQVFPRQYSASRDNLANLPTGSLDATLAPGAELVVSSGPYAESTVRGGDCTKVNLGHNPGRARQMYKPTADDTGYGVSPSNLGNLPPGRVEAVVQGDLGVASPPWENQEPSHAQADTPSSRKLRAEAAAVRGRAFLSAAYGASHGQIGNTQGDTFWSASRAIIEQVYSVLKPGAHAIWVTKMYIRDGKLVDFPGDWERLCRACGFQTIHIHLAMLVERRVETHLFEGTVTYEQWTESFFRRLGRKKTGLGIEFETVICQVKPHTAESLRRAQATFERNGPDAWGEALDAAEASFQGQSLLDPEATPMPPDEAWEQLPLVEVADCTVSSSPYAGAGEVLGTHNGIDWTKAQAQTGHRLTPGRGMYRYGITTGQLGALPEGERPSKGAPDAASPHCP